MLGNDDARMSFDNVEQINDAIRNCTVSERTLFSLNRVTKETRLKYLINKIQTMLEKANLTFQKLDPFNVKFLSDEHLNALLTNYNWSTDLRPGDEQTIINKLHKISKYTETDHYLPMDEHQVIEYNYTIKRKSMSEAELLVLSRDDKEQNLIEILEAANNAVGSGGHQMLAHYEFDYAVNNIPAIPDQELDNLLRDSNLADDIISNATGENAILQRARIEAVIKNIYLATILTDEPQTEPEPEPKPEQQKSERSSWAQRQLNKIMHPFSHPKQQSQDMDR